MKTVLDRNTTEQERHNAMISEHYRRLMDAVEDQLSDSVQEEVAYTATTYAPETPAYDTTPIVEQAPTVTEYTPSQVAASVFTAEKFERLENYADTRAIAPTAVAPAAPRTVTRVKQATEVGYSLTPLAKIAMAVFTFVVIAMLALISVNSQTIQRKSVRIRNLEEKKQELTERNEEMQRYLEELQTEESIIERAKDAGLID